jgi:hypothetical protein
LSLADLKPSRARHYVSEVYLALVAQDEDAAKALEAAEAEAEAKAAELAELKANGLG